MRDEKGYLERMEKSMQEKLFFMEHIDLNNKIVIDFGCADGTLVRKLKPFGYINTLWVGVEANDTFRDQADEVLNYSFPSLLELYKFMRTRKQTDNREVVLITSSVLHECGCTLQYDLVNFAKLYCNYWAIRDMYFDLFGFVPMMEYFTTILERSDKEQLISFLKRKLHINERLIAEWLLKYRYKDNWETEVKENYFSTEWDYLLENFTSIYDRTYRNSYIYDTVLVDYGLHVKWCTHRQLILKIK